MQQTGAIDLLALTVVQGGVVVVFVIVCLLLILVVLLQKGRGGGLAGAFGGTGGHSAFGAKTGDVFTWFTVGLTFMFFLVAIGGNYLFVPPDVTALPGVSVPAPSGGAPAGVPAGGAMPSPSGTPVRMPAGGASPPGPGAPTGGAIPAGGVPATQPGG